MQLINQLVFILIITIDLIVAFWILFSDKKSKANQYFFLSSIFIFLWISFGFLGLNYSPSLLFLRLNFSAVSLFLTSFYFFTKYFPTETRHNRSTLDVSVFATGLFFALLSATTNLIIQSVSNLNGIRTYQMGSAANLFYAFVLLVTAYTLFVLIKKYKFLTQINKSKIAYLLVGIFLFAIFNAIFNVFFPIFVPNGKAFYQFGDYSTIFLVTLTAYAIVKHQLFNVKLIATETAVIALSILLFVQVFLSDNTSESLLKGLVWILATYGGYVLVKSVKVEIMQKEKLAKLASELENANTKLKELDEAKDNFLSMASHELNTPIAAISGYLSMIIDEEIAGKLNTKMRTYLTNVFVSSKRLAALVRDLLNVSRIESNRIHIIYTEGHIEDTIQQSISEIKIKADEVGHKLIFKKPEHRLPKFWFDQSRITEVIINFIGNAIKYTDPGGKIVVNAHADEKKVIVSVSDNGRGIPADRANHIFEKFAQVDVLKDQVKGTGLGMFISKNLVEMHKGKIWFKSSVDPVDHGSTFYFSLPIVKEKPFDKFEGQGEVIRAKS